MLEMFLSFHKCFECDDRDILFYGRFLAKFLICFTLRFGLAWALHLIALQQTGPDSISASTSA
jgi:hypothetical protein